MRAHPLEAAAAMAIVSPILGLILLLSRRKMLKALFPNMEIGQAYRFLFLIPVLTWCITMAGVLVWVYSR